MNKRQSQLVLVAVLLFAASNSVSAADAGSVIFASGSVSAERQPAEALAKGDTVLVTDNVITGDASRAQLLMVDGAKVAIRPNSQLLIEEYAYGAATTTAGTTAITSSEDNSSIVSLVKGGFRTITGAIGKEDPSDYEVRTAVGVLGIRGTDFAVLLCGGDCNTAPGVTPGTIVPDGLYLMVTEGSIVFSNEVADIELTAGEFAYIPFDTRQPTQLNTAPPVFIDDSDFRFDADADAARVAPPTGFDEGLGTRRAPDTSAPDPSSTNQSDSDSSEAPKQSIQGIDRDGTPVDLTPGGAPDPGNRTLNFSTGPLGAVDTVWTASLDNEPSQYQLDGDSNLVGFGGLYPTRTGADNATFEIGTANNVDTGFDSMTVLRWGRWAGGTADITLGDGSAAIQDLESQSIHWISSPESGTAPVMPIAGSASYSLVGATSPTDNLGNVGVLGSATFDADFTNMVVDSTLVIDINGLTWSAAGAGNIGARAQLPAHLFQGNYAVIVGGSSSGTGIFSGFFSQPGPSSDPSYPGGVGLSYSLQDMGGTTTVSGAAAFGNP